MKKTILLLCTVVFAQAWAELPADYQRLSFICSSGSQSVDTGYYPGPTTRVTAEFSFVDLATTQQRVFGVVDTSLAYGFYFNGSRQYAWACQDGSGNWQSTGIAVTAARRRVTLDSAQGRVTLVDVLSNAMLYDAAMNTAHTKTAAHALRIFSSWYDDKTKEFSSIRLFSLTIADSTGTVHSYVPCLRLSDGTVGLYDEIDGVFHGNDHPGGMPFGEGPVAETAHFGVSVAANAVWSGVPATATVTVTNRTTGAVLTEGTDYTLVYTNNAAPGLARVTAVGAGDYAGERVTQSFTIYPHAMRLPLAYSELEFAESAGGQVYDTGIHLTSNTVVDLDVTPTLVAGTDYTVAFSGTSAAGTATAVVTGLGVYAGSSVTNTFSVYRTGGAFSYASWNVDTFTNGPSATGTIRWGQSPENPDALDAYQAFLADLGADWLGLNENAERFTTSLQIGSRWAYFARYPATTPAVQKGTEWNPTYRTERFEVLSSTVLDFPTRTRSTYALEERVRVDGAYEAVFVNVALDAAPVTRDAQIAYLVNRYAEEPRVVISGGFATDKILADGATRTTDWAALDPFAAAGYHLANTTLPTGPTAPTTTERTAATTHIVAKGFAVSDVHAPDPAATVTAGYFPLSDEAPLVCTLAPLASGEVAKPSAPAPQTYDGTGLVPVFTASDAYTVSAPACTNAGTYTVTVSLRDPTTTSWEDVTTADLTYTFTIEKAVNEWTTQPSVAPAAWERREGAGTLTAAVPRFGTLEHAWTQAELAALTRGTHALTFSVAGCANYSGLTTSVEVAVTETFAVQVAPDGATADIQFNCVDGARDVYLAYGSADCGGALSNWTHVVKVATVASGATACTGIALPDDLGYETPYYRFLVTTPFDSTSYATNGLLAQWDAVENAGRGVHADAPATWTELVKGLAPTVSGTPVYNARGVAMDGVYYQCEVPGVKEAINAKAFTVQAFLRPVSYVRYRGIYQFGEDTKNRELILDERREGGQNGDYTFGGLQYRENSWNGRSVITAANDFFGSNVLATVTTDAAGAHLWFNDAATAAFTTKGGSTDAVSSRFWLGTYTGGSPSPMTLYAARVYARTLTVAEIAACCTLDRARFADGEPPWLVSESVKLAEGSLIVIR